MEKQPTNGTLDGVRQEFLDCWKRLPNKGLFFLLLAAWLALFQFLGNSTQGYIPTPSLLVWMNAAYGGADAGGSDGAFAKLIPFIVVALFWWKRKELLANKLDLWWPGLLLIGLALGLHLAGYMVQQPLVSIVAFFTGIYALTGLVWGRQWLRDSFFPFCLFAFCVPLGWSAVNITFPLRLMVCRLVELISGFVLQIDIHREGTKLMDPSNRYSYDVAAACSGIRSLFATTAVAIIYAMLSFRVWWKRGLLMLSAIPLAILGNTLRLLTIVIAAEMFGQEGGNAVDKGGPFGVFSLLLYVPAFAGLMLLGHLLREPDSQAACPGQPQPAEPAGLREHL